ncbi:hypothetical protein A4X13_0g9176, partial [Tilletia indica]
MVFCFTVRLYQVAREKGLTPENIKKGYSATGIWPLRGTAAIPPSMLTAPPDTERDVEEKREEAYASSSLGDALSDLADRQRSLKAKATLIVAARSAREASAVNILFDDLTQRLRNHAAAMKAKPRPFRTVAEDFGKAKLYTSEEAIKKMEDTIRERQAEEQRKEQEADERALRKEEKEKEKEEAKLRREREKADRELRKAAELKEKLERAAAAKK